MPNFLIGRPLRSELSIPRTLKKIYLHKDGALPFMEIIIISFLFISKIYTYKVVQIHKEARDE